MANGSIRFAAAFIAATAWLGLALNFQGLRAQGQTVGNAIWILLRYFTITTNLAVAIVLTAVALGWLAPPRLIGGVTISIVLVGVVYVVLLHGTIELTGGSAVANALLHMVTPVLVPLFWLAFVEKGQLRPVDPLLFALYPAVYFPYVIARGLADGKYAYPFIDVGTFGWMRVGMNAVAIAAAFLPAVWLTLWLDRALAARM